MSDTKHLVHHNPPNIWNTPEHQREIESIETAPIEMLVERAIGRRSANPDEIAFALRLTAMKAEDRGNSYQRLNEEAGEAIHTHLAEIHRLRTALHEGENREAACCPEDFGFEEVIASLRASLEEAERVIEAATNVTESATPHRAAYAVVPWLLLTTLTLEIANYRRGLTEPARTPDKQKEPA